MDVAIFTAYKLYFLVLVVLVILDVILGIFASVHQNAFSSARMYDFLLRDVFPAFICLPVFMQVVALLLAEYATAQGVLIINLVAWAMVGLYLALSIVKSVTDMFPAKAPAPPKPAA